MDKKTERQYWERIRRINDAISLKVPDRVPTEIDSIISRQNS